MRQSSYADFDYYRAQYLGEALSKEAFPALAQRASAYLDRLTFDRAPYAGGEEQENLRLACCAVAEAFFLLDQGEIASETVGEWWRSYRRDERERGRRVYDAALIYLAGSPLLYRGVT